MKTKRVPLTESEFILKEFAKRIKKETKYDKTILYKEDYYDWRSPCVELYKDSITSNIIIQLVNSTIFVRKLKRGFQTKPLRQFLLSSPSCFDDIIATLNNAPPS